MLTCALAACAAEEARIHYPSFEIFTSSRMFKVGAGDLEKVDLAKLSEQLESLDGAHREAADFARQLFPGEHPEDDGTTAELLPKAAPGSRGVLPLAPVVMMKLEPLWQLRSWSDDQVALARDGATILTRIEGVPAVEFASGDDDTNRAALEQLVRWFHGEVARPEQLAAMIFTLDDGPFVGLPYDMESVLPADWSKRIDAHMELRLSEVAREDEAWVMQCVRDGEPIWTRVISGRPLGMVESVGFIDVAPVSVGSYGWHVPFWVSWTYGREQAHLYLDSRGELLFYFLSW